MRLGMAAFVLLAILTAVEYAIATQMEDNLIPLLLIVQVKAAMIIWYFMHVARTWMGQGH
jgi:hypothetical protein